jgi:DNA-binding beta-propeller fold protein YncE
MHWLMVLALWLALLGLFVSPAAVRAAPPSAYVVNSGENTVSQYVIDPLSGILSPNSPPTVPTDSTPLGVAVSPDGRSVYAANDFSFTVTQYDVDPVTSTLTPKTPPSVQSPDPVSVAVSPDGRSVYVTNPKHCAGTNPPGPCTPDSVSQYDVDPGTGALTPKTPAEVLTGATPTGIAVSPDSRNVYVANQGDKSVSQFSVDPATGALSPKNPATVPTGAAPEPIIPLPDNGVAVSRDGRSVYVTNLLDSSVSQYSIDQATGALSAKTPLKVSTPAGPDGIAISSDGRAVYIATGNDGAGTVSQYAVNPVTGGLSPKTPLTQAALGAESVAVSPDGHSAYVTSGNNYISQFTIGPDDALTAKTPSTIASGSNPVAIATSPPVLVSTVGCRVFGHGRITAANGDRASFRGLAVASPPRGAELYRDNGPANPMRVRSSSVDAVTCNTDATRASVFGKATINGAGSVEYRIDVQLAATTGGNDTYRIRLSNGYDSGSQPIRHGDTDIRLRSAGHRHHDGDADRGEGRNNQDGG